MDTPAKMTKMRALERMKSRVRKYEDQHLKVMHSMLSYQQITAAQHADVCEAQTELIRKLVRHFVGAGEPRNE